MLGHPAPLKRNLCVSDSRRLSPEGLLPLATGVLWLTSGAAAGPVGFLVALVPGCLGIASGGALLLWEGDRRIGHYAALASLLGIVLAIPGLWAVGILNAFFLGLLSAASFIAVGRASLRLGIPVAGVPAPENSVAMAAKVAVDEALMAHLQLSLRYPSEERARVIAREVGEARVLFRERGWLEKPLDYHRQPPPLLDPEIRTERSRGIEFEHLQFESGFEPRPEEPGSARWHDWTPNQTSHAWVIRHAGPPRPWLVCINGYRMGFPLVDLRAFDPRIYHQQLGLNLLMPVLPLHGPRRVGRQSGDRFLDGNLVDTVHAETQAMWDIRRLLSWVRGEGAPKIGVYGLSLGGYNASLLSCVDSDLACVIAGVPLTDIPGIFWHHGSPPRVRELERAGLRLEDLEEVFSVVSPLVLESQVPLSGRMIFGGVGDRVVPAEQVRALYERWNQPGMIWYQGGHVTFPFAAEVRAGVHQTLRETALAL